MIKNLDAIKESADIVRLIETYVTLRKSGANYVACCPFHDEKSPSFVVSPRKQNYVCYGCGRHGDALDFLQEHNRMSFVEAVEHLAKLGNETVQYERSRAVSEEEYTRRKEEKDALLDVLERAQRVFHPSLHAYGDDELILVDGRPFRAATVRAFGLGFLEKGDLLGRIGSTGAGGIQFAHEELTRAGLIKPSQHGGHYEFFGSRSIYPIYNQQGRVVAFAGRKQDGANGPKYINSEESVVYQKSRTLYGISQAGRAIGDADEAYLVEGYTDVLRHHDIGLTNTVGACGTAITADHAKLLAKYANCVTIVTDGDEAGYEAARRAVGVLAEHLEVRVVLLPIERDAAGNLRKTDPDQFVRELGADIARRYGLDPEANLPFVLSRGGWEYREFLRATSTDGILWVVQQRWDPDDVHRQEEALELAGELLAKLNPTLRDRYVQKLCAKNVLGAVKRPLSDIIEKKLNENKKKRKHDDQQRDDAISTGFYIAGNRYVKPGADGADGVPLTSFIVKSSTLVKGKKGSKRIIEVVNEKGDSFMDYIESELFTDFGRFQAFVESKGYYVFRDEGPKWWPKIREFVYRKQLEVVPITTLGWHAEGFWVWKNGVWDGRSFLPVSDRGIVTVNGENYMILNSVKWNSSKADDDDNTEVVEGQFFHYHLGACPSLRDYGVLLRRAYGSKAIPGLAYMVAALYRDFVFKQLAFFPLLNLFGQPGSGKNKFYDALMAFFGPPKIPVDITNTTEKSLPRLFAQMRNAVVWLDEYKNTVDPMMLAALRGSYNASGRLTADYTSGNETKQIPAKSAIMVSGEHRPTADPALYMRMIALESETGVFNDDTTEAYERIQDIQVTGTLTQLTCKLLAMRPKIEREFKQAYFDALAGLRDILRGSGVEARLISNYAVLLAIWTIIGTGDDALELPFSTSEIADECVYGIRHQDNILRKEDHVSTFWRIIASLLEGREMQHERDYIIQTLDEVTLKAKERENQAGGKDTRLHQFQEAKRLIFVRLPKVHGLYLEFYSRQYRGNGMALGTLEHYLLNSRGFLGICKAKKFGGTAFQAMVFDTALLPVELMSPKEESNSPLTVNTPAPTQPF